MPNEPSLGEIINAGNTASPDLGIPATVIDNSGLVKQLNENARYKAENDWRKYNMFLSNLKESYKDLGDIAGMEVATQDRDALKQQTADIFKEIADNPRAFFGGQKLGEIQAKISGLRSAATESKLNRVYDMAHREYLVRNPELNTQENQGKINEYWKQPLGKRNPYMLNMPAIFDAQELMKNVLAQPGVQLKFAHSELTNAAGQPGNEFIRELEGTRTSRDAYLNAWKTGWITGKDKYGHSIRSAIEQQFNQLPDAQKQQFGSPENYYMALGAATFNSDKDIQQVTKDVLKANPNLFKAEELALKKEGVNQRWAMYGLAKRKLDDAEEEELYGADTAINDVLSIIEKGSPVTYTSKDGSKREYTETSDPDILKQYASIDKEGKTTNVADVMRYDKDKDQFALVYFKKKPYSAKTMTGGDIVMKNGERVIDKVIPIDSRTVLRDKVNLIFPNKDKGKVYKLVDDVLEKNKGGLYEILQKKEGKEYKRSNEQKSYKYGNQTFTYDKVEKAAKQEGITVDEYIKKFGLK